MQLYEFRRSRSIKCHWLVKELGIDCEITEVNLMEGEHMKPEFLKMNPWGKVPVLVDGDLKLHEASAILFYLADKYPEKNLIPKLGTSERTELMKWMFFMANEMECILWNIEKNKWGYPEDKRSEVAIEMSKEDFKKAVSIIDQHMQGRQFMVGDCFSIADISLAYLLGWSQYNDLLEGTKHLKSYETAMMDRPNFPCHFYEN